ncbi:UNC45-central domain-containing protein [Rhodotorula paludigena]|uniref:UNC45-central domain-containing protein n=1 Tax=Rhodotorula paludigena TaxID=86838 RepID=UPI00317462C2
MAPPSSSSGDELKAMLSRPSPLDLTCDELDKLLSALKSSTEQHTLALAVLARFLSPSPTSTTRSALQDALESRLSGSDSAELVEGLSALSGVLQVAPAVAASLLQLDSLRSRLEEAVELISRPVGKGKAKQDDEMLALVELLSLAAGQPSMRGLVRSSAGEWLESLLGSPSNEVAGGGTEAKRTALAGVAVVKLRLGKEEPSTTGLPTADTGGSPSRWTLEDLARLFVRLVASRKAVTPAGDVILPSLEALAYLTLAPSPPVKKIATDSSFLATLFSLAPKTATAPTLSESARDYAVATLLDHLAVFPSPDAQGDAAQVERLKRFAAAAAQKGDAGSPVQPETVESVTARVGLLVRHDPSPIPTVRQLCLSPSLQTRRLAARILHSFVTPQSLRGELLQAGAARLLLSLIRQLPAPFSPAHDTPAVQGLAKLYITANPLLIFGGSPSAPLLLEATTALTLPLAVSASSDGGPASLLATLESLMALTNIASLDPALTEQLARLELRDRPSSANKLLDVVNELLLSSNAMVRRAATELVCNLAASDAGIAYFEPPQEAPLDGPKPPSAKLHVVLALASSPDKPTRLAASGALTSLVYSPRIALALCAFAKWREMLLVLCGDDVPGVRHRVYEAWRVLAEMVEQLPDAKERESARKGIEDGKVRAALEAAAQAEKVAELQAAASAAVKVLKR